MEITLTTSAGNKRYVGIDRLRGWLIILVLIGHIVLGSVHDNVIRYSIYAFHMPLFIGLTGYLINAETLKRSLISQTAIRYWWRVLFPFAFTFVFFTAILMVHAFEEGRITTKLLLSFFHSPYYHLWFVPTLVIWVVAFSLLLKSKISLSYTLLFFLLVSFVWAGVPTAEHWPVVASVLSKKVIYFFSFFLFGAWLRTSSSRNLRAIFSDFKVLPLTLIVACAGLYLLNIGFEKSVLRAAVWLLMNIALITLLIDMSISNTRIKPSFISEMGRHSLPIYLWHFAPLFVLKGLDIHHTHILAYYFLGSVSVLLIVFAVVRGHGQSKLVDRCFYGVN